MIVYKIGNSAYINLTNKCSNSCIFCVRDTSEHYGEFDLWLKKEPTAEEVIGELKNFDGCEEYVFCGYGEPLYRLGELLKIAEYLKTHGKKVRLNTNGQAELIAGKSVAEKLKGRVDTVSISLNAGNAKSYNALCRPVFGEKAYESVKKFAEECRDAGIDTVFSMVKCDGADVVEAQNVADEMKIPLRVRELIK
jgi:TatD family-associated radical SAM protein